MSAGDKWRTPGDHEGIETDGSTRTTLRLMMLKPNWPFPTGVREIPRLLCTKMPSRYHGEEYEDAKW